MAAGSVLAAAALMLSVVGACDSYVPQRVPVIDEAAEAAPPPEPTASPEPIIDPVSDYLDKASGMVQLAPGYWEFPSGRRCSFVPISPEYAEDGYYTCLTISLFPDFQLGVSAVNQVSCQCQIGWMYIDAAPGE